MNLAMHASEIAIGNVFGRLTVAAAAGKNSLRKRLWLVRCECGETLTVVGSHLVNGNTRSCGCLHNDELTKHGMCRHPLYGLWLSMRRRCMSVTSDSYAYYGGRGITICDRWSDFSNFVADMSPRPSPEHTIDRMDNDGPYSPENCRWATKSEQAANTRVCKPITFEGRTLTASEWGRERGLIERTILRRLQEGWTVEQALQPPIPRGRRRQSAPF
jgi:hypothetical protein